MSSNIVVKTEVQKIVVKNADGKDGKSAYQQAVDGGYTGTEQDFNCSLSLLADVADGKKQIADAINTKGGSASADSSFSQLADDVLAMPTSGILANGITQTEPFSFLKYITTDINNEITEIYDSEITTIEKSYAFYKNIALIEVVMSKLATISGSYTFGTCSSLQSVQFPNLTSISSSYCFSDCTSLIEIICPNLECIVAHYVFNNNPFLKSFIFPRCSVLYSDSFKIVSPENIVFGKLIEIHNIWGRSITSANLRNITIGQDTDIDLPFNIWKATNVIVEGQSGIDELNNNLYNNLLTKLYDHSQDGQTRTLRIGWLANVSEDNIAYANSKGWTLTK